MSSPLRSSRRPAAQLRNVDSGSVGPGRWQPAEVSVRPSGHQEPTATGHMNRCSGQSAGGGSEPLRGAVSCGETRRLARGSSGVRGPERATELTGREREGDLCSLSARQGPCGRELGLEAWQQLLARAPSTGGQGALVPAPPHVPRPALKLPKLCPSKCGTRENYFSRLFLASQPRGTR